MFFIWENQLDNKVDPLKSPRAQSTDYNAPVHVGNVMVYITTTWSPRICSAHQLNKAKNSKMLRHVKNSTTKIIDININHCHQLSPVQTPWEVDSIVVAANKILLSPKSSWFDQISALSEFCQLGIFRHWE